MQKVVEFAKNIVLTTVGVASLVVVVYVGAVGFMTAILADKLLKAFGSQLTVQNILADFDAAYHSPYDEYRHNWDNFHFKDLKLPF